MQELPIRLVITQGDLGPRGWRMLHDLAKLRNRDKVRQAQVRSLLQYALYHALAGEDVELSRSRLEALFEDERLEPVA